MYGDTPPVAVEVSVPVLSPLHFTAVNVLVAVTAVAGCVRLYGAKSTVQPLASFILIEWLPAARPLNVPDDWYAPPSILYS